MFLVGAVEKMETDHWKAQEATLQWTQAARKETD